MFVDIDNVRISFPFQPYPIQVDYMRSVIASLEKKENAILESPTGTGKTLSLLCATLGWLKRKSFLKNETVNNIDINEKCTAIARNGGSAEKRPPSQTPIRVIYTSRTHSQLNQACKELKNSDYNHYNTVVIGSREQLCINAEVLKSENSSAMNQSCQFKVKNKLCSFHHNYEEGLKEMGAQPEKIYDIEDLLDYGKKHQACPYYMAKERANLNTPVIFMPYNYVLEPSIRKRLKINFENAIVIFDEGHNIERVCEDSMSLELRSESIATMLTCLDDFLLNIHKLETGESYGDHKLLQSVNVHDLAKAKGLIIAFEKQIDYYAKKYGEKKVEDVLQLLVTCNLNMEGFSILSAVCEKVIEYTMTQQSFLSNARINAITNVVDFIERFICKSSHPDTVEVFRSELSLNFRVSSEIDFNNSTLWKFNLWCMTPSLAMKSLMNEGVHNVIITSGTLSPLESFDKEMGLPFAIKLQNDHVISDKQLSFHLISKDPKGNLLDGKATNRSGKYYDGLGLTIIDVARIVPKGMFIFFSSYGVMNSCIASWKNGSVWKTMTKLKSVFQEPPSKATFNQTLADYCREVDSSPNGAMFMAVSRGKLSEGIDLNDDYCRAVVVTSLPYPAAKDPRVLLKKDYLDKKKSDLTGWNWYSLQMKRAMNQAIGRVIRHKADYGAIIVCDSRFQTQQDGLPKWIRKFSTPANIDLGTHILRLKQFFGHARTTQVPRPTEPRKTMPIDWNEKKIELDDRCPQPKATDSLLRVCNATHAHSSSSQSSKSIFDQFNSQSPNSQKRNLSSLSQKENSNCKNDNSKRLKSENGKITSYFQKHR